MDFRNVYPVAPANQVKKYAMVCMIETERKNMPMNLLGISTFIYNCGSLIFFFLLSISLNKLLGVQNRRSQTKQII